MVWPISPAGFFHLRSMASIHSPWLFKSRTTNEANNSLTPTGHSRLAQTYTFVTFLEFGFENFHGNFLDFRPFDFRLSDNKPNSPGWHSWNVGPVDHLGVIICLVSPNPVDQRNVPYGWLFHVRRELWQRSSSMFFAQEGPWKSPFAR